MQNDENSRKIKSQKFAAIMLIIGSILLILNELKKKNFSIIGSFNFYTIICSLTVLIFCGCLGLRNSLLKEKKL